jgi:hypothetical protein
MDKDIRYYEGAFTEAIRRIVGDSLHDAPFSDAERMVKTVETLKKDIGILDSLCSAASELDNPKSKRELSAEEAQQVLIDALKDWERPCPECEYSRDGGCTKWDCVMESKRIEDALARARAKSVFRVGEYYDFGTEDAFGGVFGVSFGRVKIMGRQGDRITFEDMNGSLRTVPVSVGIHHSEVFYPFGEDADAEGKVFKATADHQRLWGSHSERRERATA